MGQFARNSGRCASSFGTAPGSTPGFFSRRRAAASSATSTKMNSGLEGPKLWNIYEASSLRLLLVQLLVVSENKAPPRIATLAELNHMYIADTVKTQNWGVVAKFCGLRCGSTPDRGRNRVCITCSFLLTSDALRFFLSFA